MVTSGDMMRSKFINLLTSHQVFLPVGHSRPLSFSFLSKDKVYAAIIISLALMLASCQETPSGRVQISGNIMKALTKQIPSYSSGTSGTVSSASDFHKAVLQAVETNEGYRAALSLEQEMIAGVGVAESVRRWQVAGTSTIGSLREQGGNGPSRTTTGMAAGIQASQLVYDGGESVANIDIATAEAVGARIDRIITGNKLALEAARAWIDVWQYTEKLNLLNARSMEMKKVVSQIERMAANGMMDRAALDSVLRKIVDISLEQARLQSSLDQSQIRFSRFFEQKPTELTIPTGLVTMSDARAQVNFWQEAPELQRSAVELMTAQYAVLAAQAAFGPKAKFQTGVNSPIQDGESTDINIGLALEYTLGDGGRRKSQLDAAIARVDSVKTSLVGAQRSLKMEIDGAVQQLSEIEGSMPLLARQVTLSSSGAKTAKSQLATGQASLNQVVQAKIEHYRAEEQQISMRAEKVGLQFFIASRTGLLGRLLGLPTDIAE